MIVDTDADDGEVIWSLDAAAAPEATATRFAEFVRDRGGQVGDDYRSLWEWSVGQPEEFWALFAEFAGLKLGGQEGDVRTTDPMPGTRWFPGRTLNVARHLLDGRTGTALVAVAEDGAVEEIDFDRLRAEVGALARHLTSLGVRSGDRVVGILPNIPEAVVGFLATASIGAVWSVCAPEFGPGAIVSRFAQLEAKVAICVPGYVLGGRDRDRSAELAEILSQLPTVSDVVWVTRHTGIPVPAALTGTSWEAAVADAAEPAYLEVEFSHPLWVLFSSGTTGIPKGIVHGHGGALIEELKMLLIHTDLRPGDRFFNVASTSWVLWNSLVCALGVGAVPVLVDGNPTYPSVDRVWQVVAQTHAAALGVSAGFIHACAKTDLVPRSGHDLSSLRSVQVTGSPLSADGYRWVYRNVGDVWLSSMSGGTDIASIFVGGVPTVPVRVGRIQAPALGVHVESWDDAGAPTTDRGELVVTLAMPSMPLRLWGDDDGSRYRASYFERYPGVWRHGDFVELAEDGILIHGRSDSTLNRNGLRLGSADIYAAVEPLSAVAEALVVGAELGVDGYYMPLFVSLVPGADADEAKTEIVAAIRRNLSARYLPDEIVVMRGIPHTRTGKKLEVPVKRLLQGATLDEVVDPGALDDAALIREYADFAASRAERD